MSAKISVIIAVYNQEKYLGRCLRSLLDQTIDKSKYEIIIIDDGSEDKTKFIIDAFIDPSSSKIKYYSNEINKGLPYSLNYGIKQSVGEYIVRVDSDDFVNKNFLNILSLYLDTNENTEAIGCDYLLIDNSENVIERIDCFKEPIACGIMFRKQSLLDIGLYDEEFKLHEDKELRVRFLKKYTIDHIKIPLYRYRRHLKNITNDKERMAKYEKFLMQKHGKGC